VIKKRDMINKLNFQIMQLGSLRWQYRCVGKTL